MESLGRMKDFFAGLGSGMAEAFRTAFNAVIGVVNQGLAGAANILSKLKALQDKLPGGNPAGGAMQSAIDALQAGIPSLAHGGIVPGPVGAPRLAVVHGGEAVTPPGSRASMQGRPFNIVLQLDGRVLAVAQGIMAENDEQVRTS